MSNRPSCLVLAALVPFASIPAQTKERPDPAMAPTGAAVAAALEKGGVLVLRGKVSRRDPNEGQGMGGTMVVSVGGGDEGKPFTGDVEVLRPRAGELLIASSKLVPGVVVYEADEARLVQTTCSDEAVNASGLAADLVGLMDLPRLARTVAKQDLKVERDEKSGITGYRCTLPKSWLRQAGGIAQLFKPKVLGVQVVVRVDDKQRLQGLRFEVQHSDPTAAICEQAQKGELDAKTMTLEEAANVEDRAGATTVYDLTVAQEPAARTAAALDAMRKALHEEGR